MSCTKADLSTEGRGPVCRVPIPTLSHFPLVNSTTIPVAVRYSSTDSGILSTRVLLPILQLQIQQQCRRIIGPCLLFITIKDYY